MAVLGGTGSFLGPFLGATVYLLLQDWLSKTTERWPFFLGLALRADDSLRPHRPRRPLRRADGPLRRRLADAGPQAEETA